MSIVAPKGRKHLSADALFDLVRNGFADIPDYCPNDRHCSADSEIAIDRVDDLFYTTGPNLLLLRGAHHVRTG